MPEEPEKLVFYPCEIVVNEKDTFSGVVLEPGTNANNFYYSKEDVAHFAIQLPKVPLVKDHSLSVEAAVGRFIGSEMRADGAAIGHFHISPSEPQILAKVKDGTIKNLSIAHTVGTAQYCSICGNPIGAKNCTHVPGTVYNGQKCGMGFIDSRLVHVSLVQRGAGEGTSVLLNELTTKAKSLVDEIESLKLITAKQADELAQTKTELERVRALRLPEPQSRIQLTPESSKRRTLRDDLGI